MRNNILGILIVIMVIILAACSQNQPEPTLESQYGTSFSDDASDAAGNAVGIYVVGTTYGALADSSRGDGDAYIRQYSFSGSILWQKQFGTSSADSATDITIRGNRIYVLGHTYGDLAGSVGLSDVYLRQYDDGGNVIWTRQFGTPDRDFAIDIATDTGGNAIVLSKDGTTDFTLRKISITGAVSTLASFTSSVYLPFRAAAMAMDSSNNIYILLDRDDEASGQSNVYLFKYSPSGTFLGNAYVATSASEDYAKDIRVVGSQVFVLLTEDTQSIIRKFPRTISPSTLPLAEVALPSNVEAYAMKASGDSLYVSGYILQSLGNVRAYVARYTTGFDFRWSRRISTIAGSSFGLAVSAANNAVFPVGMKTPTPENPDAFIARVNMDTGSVAWQR